MVRSSPDNRQFLHPFLDSVATLISSCRSNFIDLVPLDIENDLKSIYGKFEGGDLFISNELHSSRAFRKIHLEIAGLGDGLQILHCVFFPEPTFDLPIFGVDVVIANAVISAAIVDLSPVGARLPIDIEQKLKSISRYKFKNQRELPEWGNIFSEYVCFVRLEGKEEKIYFFNLVERYLKILLQASFERSPENKLSPSTIERYEFQHNYCLQQKRNDKTRNVLAKAFNPQWADHYIEKLLFDSPHIYSD